MSERSIVLISGKPGSGKTTLATNLVAAYNHSPDVAAISVGQEVRDIYTGDTPSSHVDTVRHHLDSSTPYTLLDDDTIYDITLDALQRHRHASLVFLDGFPRRLSQVDDLHSLASSHHLSLPGMIETVVDDELAIVRQLKRRRPHDPTTLTSAQAAGRIAIYHQHMPATILALEYHGVYHESISTAGPKEEALTRAVGAVSLMLALGDRRRNHRN